jgi:hypothetical protein
VPFTLLQASCLITTCRHLPPGSLQLPVETCAKNSQLFVHPQWFAHCNFPKKQFGMFWQLHTLAGAAGGADFGSKKSTRKRLAGSLR